MMQDGGTYINQGVQQGVRKLCIYEIEVLREEIGDNSRVC
jgi:hypothetical protein